VLQPLLAEFKRRRVFRALIGYGIASFAVLQVSEPVIHALHLPEWTLSFMVVALGAGFPIVVVLAWAFDVSSSGVERTAPAATAGEFKGARLALVLVGLGLVAAAPGIIYFFAIRSGGHSVTERTASTDAIPRSTSVAVLPFADMSPGKDQEYFADGIAEEILNALAQVEGLQVSGRTSSFSFKGKPTDLAEIGRRLNVATVLEGSVRKAGRQMKITAQLVNTSDGFHVWSRTFDRDLTDIFPVQEEIARDVVAALKVRLLPGRAPSTKWMRTSNPEVHNQYLLGREFDRRGSTDDWRRALAAYQKALALDPEYAPAWAGVSFTLFDLEVFY
jgi:TolB-like protein